MTRMTVVPERLSDDTDTAPGRYAYHLAKGQYDDVWQPIHCGEGIALPWRTTVERDDVCRACLKAANR